jgi:protein Mpv17
LTGGALGFTADVISQYFFDPPSPTLNDEANAITKSQMTVLEIFGTINWQRTAKFTALAACFTSPTIHFWYRTLASRIPGTSMMATLQRLTLDQLVFAPLFIPSFFSMALLLDGTPELIPVKLEADWSSTVLANYAVWVPAQFLNFKFVPPQFQVLFSHSVGFFWNIYLSFVTYDSATTATTTTDAETYSTSSTSR